MGLLDILQGVGNILDTPGSVVRGLLSGDAGRAFGGIFTPEQRVSGEDMLNSWGIDGGPIGGLAATLATDPLMYGGGALLKLLRGGEAAAPAAKVIQRGIAPTSEALAPNRPLLQLLQESTPKIAPPFYSRAEMAIDSLPESIKAQSALNLMKKAPGGVSQEEIAQLGLPEYLAGRGKVQKSDLLEYAKSKQPKLQHSQSEESELLYPSHATPGGSDYTEHLVSIPGTNNAYYGPHWDEPNVIAHSRYHTRDLPGGGQALHIDEIQSDWHQAGRQQGYNKSTGFQALTRDGQIIGEGNTAEEARAAAERYMDRYGIDPYRLSEHGGNAYDVTNIPGIPEGPFKDSWHELMMKTLLRKAAENDISQVTWNTGKQIQNLVGGELAGQEHFYDKILPGFMNKYAKKWGVNVGQFEIPGVDPNQVSHGIRMTPEMIQDILYKGQPLMAIPLLATLLQRGQDNGPA